VSALVLANLVRRRGRTLLTASGIAVGVATIVALLSLTAGLQQRAGELVHLGRADLGVFQRNAADLTTSVLPLRLVAQLRARADIADATPVQVLVESVSDDPGAVVFGADPRGFLSERLVFTAGGPATRSGQILVGDRFAERHGLVVGDEVTVALTRFRVAGIYHAGVFFEDSGAVLPLGVAQELAGRRRDEVTTIAVALEPDVPAEQAMAALSERYPSLQAIGSADEAARVGANSTLIVEAVPLLVVLAHVVGGLGVANTMLMAVLEREREVALLAAIGWSPRQIGGVVMGEAVAVSVIGVALGLGIGIAAGEALPRLLSLLDVVEPDVTAWVLGRGMLVGLATGLIGGAYPTWRATRLAPAGVLARA
jgi:putative ABC transport system permease protein